MRIFDFFCEFTVAFWFQLLYSKGVRKTNDFFLHILLIPKKQMPVSICLFVFRHDRFAVVTIYYFFSYPMDPVLMTNLTPVSLSSLLPANDVYSFA